MVHDRGKRAEEGISKCQHLPLGPGAMGDFYFLLSAFLYYINSLYLSCFYNQKKNPCYVWRKQNLRDRGDFALFVLYTSGGIKSLILVQGTLNIWVQTHYRFMLKQFSTTALRSSNNSQTSVPCTGLVSPSVCWHTLRQWLSRDPVLSVTCVAFRGLILTPEECHTTGRQKRKLLEWRGIIDATLRHPRNPTGQIEESASSLPRIFMEGNNIGFGSPRWRTRWMRLVGRLLQA